jgi:hypothetical protein
MLTSTSLIGLLHFLSSRGDLACEFFFPYTSKPRRQFDRSLCWDGLNGIAGPINAYQPKDVPLLDWPHPQILMVDDSVFQQQLGARHQIRPSCSRHWQHRIGLSSGEIKT